MSLKAKLEAVIYAAEEPVTLAQLAILFTEEALAWKAEQEAAATDEAASAEPTLLNPELDYPIAESAPELIAEAADATESTVVQLAMVTEPASDSGAENVEASGAGNAPTAEEASVADEKKLARERDRQVRAILRKLLDELIENYAADEHGIEIREIAGGYRMATKPECHDVVRALVKSLKPPLKLSLPALETLAVIAYKQPVTAPEVNEIRGVDSSGVFGSLLARKLIATAGRKQVIGRPILYKTTREFLLRFGLRDVSELPSLEEFEKMAASELDDSEPVSDTQQGETALLDEQPDGLSANPDENAGSEPENETAEAAPRNEAVVMTAESDTAFAEPAPGGAEQQES